MRISVITIAWNDLNGLQTTIESVRSQSYTDIEHIIVDGGSQDGTDRYLGGLESRIRWVSEKDAGRYDAMNKGARMATGDLLWFLHSSDKFHSNEAVSFVVKEYAKNSFEWAHGISRIVDGSRIVGMGGKIPFDHGRFLIGGHVIPHQATVFSRRFFWELEGYNPKFGLSADQLFMMKASMHVVPTVWGEVLCDFDALGAGSTRGAWSHYRDMIRARNLLGVTVTGAKSVDGILSVYYAASTMFDRVLRKLLRRSRPSIDARKAS